VKTTCGYPDVLTLPVASNRAAVIHQAKKLKHIPFYTISKEENDGVDELTSCCSEEKRSSSNTVNEESTANTNDQAKERLSTIKLS